MKKEQLKTTVKGYKVFNPDLTCRDYQFKVGETFKHEGEIKICSSGFHFCLNAAHCFEYYPFDTANIVCEVEALGEVQTHADDSKICTNELQIIRQLEWHEVLTLVNTGNNNTGRSNSGNRNSGNWNSGDMNSGNRNSGDRNSGDRNSGNRNSGNWNSGDMNSGNRNSGDWNSGDWNSGDRNSGDWNSGDWNSGDRNSGNWNSGDRNSGDSNSGYRSSGAFCVDDNPILMLFDKPCKKMTVKEWENSKAVQLMYSIDTTIWVPWSVMTKEEKEANPKYELSEGYTKAVPIKEAWQNNWNNWTEENKSVFTSLENFDKKIFERITGIKINYNFLLAFKC